MHPRASSAAVLFIPLYLDKDDTGEHPRRLRAPFRSVACDSHRRVSSPFGDSVAYRVFAISIDLRACDPKDGPW